MTDKIDDGGPAFPSRPPMWRVSSTDPYSVELVRSDFDGMSLRDWFAGQAMAGICAHPDTWGQGAEGISEHAYSVADAMLSARKGKT